MTSEPDKQPDENASESQKILSDYDRIQEQLRQGFEGDPRLSSGVPAAQRGGDIEFIQMSGLVRPSATPETPDPVPLDSDLDASRPVSFFEKGVADVDADMVPGHVEDRSVARDEIEPVETARAAMAHLRDIIADLTRDAPPPDTDAALLARLESAPVESHVDVVAPEVVPDIAAQLVPEIAAEVVMHIAADVVPDIAPGIEPEVAADVFPDVVPEIAASEVETESHEPEQTEALDAPGLEDLLAELGSAHPMHDEIEEAAAEIAPIASLIDEPSIVPSEPIVLAPVAIESPVLVEPPTAINSIPMTMALASDEVAPKLTPAPRQPMESKPVAAEERVQTPVPPGAPKLIRKAPTLTPDHSARLAEAEKLLEELEPEPIMPVSRFESTIMRETAFNQPTQFDGAANAVATDDLPDESLDYQKKGRRRHRSTGKRTVARRLVRLAAGLLVAVGLLIATYTGYAWLQQRMVSANQLYNQAGRAMAKGEYASASQMYEEFAALHPADPLRAEAQFAAAFAMQLQKPADNDDAQEQTRQSLRLFEQFCTDNPTHPKRARAETLMGRLNFESGRYQEAIELLRNPELRLLDPASAVPALRTLARAFAKMGDAESARSYYLQSVGVQDNHSPDVDYSELGSLYQSLADRSEDLDKRIRLQQLAIESWTHALEVAGIDPSSKQAIRSQLDVLRERLQNEPGMAPAMESLGLADEIQNEQEALPMDGAEMPVSDLASPTPSTAAEAPVAAPVPAAPTNLPVDVATPSQPADEAALPVPESAPSDAPAPHEAIAPPANKAAVTPVPDAPRAGEYVVKSGDTLTAIANTYGSTVNDMIELNALSSDQVFVGQHLIVPEAHP